MKWFTSNECPGGSGAIECCNGCYNIIIAEDGPCYFVSTPQPTESAYSLVVIYSESILVVDGCLQQEYISRMLISLQAC